MNLFSQYQSLQLLIFYKDDQEFVANSDYVLFMFFYNIIKVTHLLYRFIILICLIFSFLRIRSLLILIPCAYVSIESIDCILLSSFELKAVLLISSVKTLCFSLLFFCCVFNITFLCFMISLRL